MDWFKGKSTGNHRFSHEIWGFPVNFPLNQSIDSVGKFSTSQLTSSSSRVELSEPGRCTLQRGVVAEVGDPWRTLSWSLRGDFGEIPKKNGGYKSYNGKIMLKWRFEWEKH